MWQSKREISRKCNDIIGSVKGSQISETYWGEVGKGKRADIYLEVRKRMGHIFFGWNKCLCISLYHLSCISDAFSLMFTADFFWFIKCLYIYTVPSPSVTNIYHTIIFYKLTLWNYKYNVLYGSIPISEHKHSMVYLYFCLYMYLFYVEFSTYMYNCYLYLNRGW
jgi:hypothetical protein